MVDFELKRDRVTIRCRGHKWEWIIEPRYWRNSILWVTAAYFSGCCLFYKPGAHQHPDLGKSLSSNCHADVADDFRHRPG